MPFGNRMWLCLAILILHALSSSCTTSPPTDEPSNMATPTEPSFQTTPTEPSVQATVPQSTEYMYNYDYPDYTSGDYPDPCDGWQDNLQELHFDRAVTTEFTILTCPYSECWEFQTTTWYKEGVRYKWKNTELIQQTGDKREKLTFWKVYRDDAGNYTCEMTNGTHTFTGSIRLSTRDPESTTAPIMQPVSPPTAYRRPGDNVTFLCQANFGVIGPAHFPQLYWTKNNSFVHGSDTTSRANKDGSYSMNNTLTLTDLTEEDFGEYVCTAHTTFGYAQENATLVNGDPPTTNRIFHYAHPAAITCPLLFVVLVAVLVLVYKTCQLEIQLLWKDYFAQFEDDDYKKCDAIREDYTFDLDQLQGTHFSFEVRASRDVRIALSNQRASTPDMFEIVIGAEWNARSLVRKQGYLLMMVATQDVLSPKEWRRFWVTFMDGTLEVGRQGELEPFLRWRDPDLAKVKYVGYSSGSGDKVKLKFADLGTKDHDVIILYDQAQLGFVLNTLRVFLEDTCNLVVAMEDLDFEIGIDIAENWVEFVEKARHCLIVLSQDFLRNQWLQFGFSVALERMLTRNSRITIIEYETVQEIEDFREWKSLRHTMKAVKCIKWSDTDLHSPASRFWKELRFQMPKKRVPSTIHRRRTTCTTGTGSTCNSQTSLLPALSSSESTASYKPDIIRMESETIGNGVGGHRGALGKIDVIPEHESIDFDNNDVQPPSAAYHSLVRRNESNLSDNVFFPNGYEISYL
ncbi:interleukin-1 receptor accessory protein-like 1 [Branchiostoma floridae x Branchiostoma belcheri]